MKMCDFEFGGELYKLAIYLHKSGIEIHTDKKVLLVNFLQLDELTNKIKEIFGYRFDEDGIEATVKDGYVAIDIDKLLEFVDIEEEVEIQEFIKTLEELEE